MDMTTAVRFVDDYMDKDPKTRDSSPGKVNGHRLIKIGIQTERRLTKLWKKSIKHIIFLAEGTREIWYKNSFDSPGVVVMGFSLDRLKMHPKAVPMETYAQAFLEPQKFIAKLNTTGEEWLARNDFALI